MIAIVEAYREGLLVRRYWINNLIAGLVVGVVALPLAMAFAIASGAKPEQGIYTAIVGGALVSLFGGSRLQIAGPTGAFIVILSGITAQYGIAGLQLATLMAGAMLLIMGITRMGALIRFIPNPVIVGFTAGIAVIIWVGQWQEFFGLSAVKGAHFHQKLAHALSLLPSLHIPTAVLAVISLIIVLHSTKIPRLKKVPGPLAALIFATLIQYFVPYFHEVKTIGSAFGGIPVGLPTLQMPEISISQMIILIGPAFTIAMLGAIESLLSAVVADGMTGTRHHSNQELIGQGIANIALPFFGGFAATGALARTATNVRNGGNSPLSGMVHALFLVMVLMFLAPLANNIPLCTLSAILFVVAWNMSDTKNFIRLARRAPRADVAVLLITFGLTVLADLIVAVNIGVIIATLHFMRRMSSGVEMRENTHDELKAELSSLNLAALPEGVVVFTLDGPLFFGAVENVDRALRGTHTDPKLLVIRMGWVPFIDITGIESLESVIEHLQERGVKVALVGANPRVKEKLIRAGMVSMLGEKYMGENLADALSTLPRTTD